MCVNDFIVYIVRCGCSGKYQSSEMYIGVAFISMPLVLIKKKSLLDVSFTVYLIGLKSVQIIAPTASIQIIMNT